MPEIYICQGTGDQILSVTNESLNIKWDLTVQSVMSWFFIN